MKRWVACAIVACIATAIAGAGRSWGQVQVPTARLAHAFIMGLDFDRARRVLAVADGDDPHASLERARLAIYEMDCDGAAAILARAEVQRLDDGPQLADIARGCQRTTAALVSLKDDALGVEVRWQDEHDASLAPLLLETIVQARDALSRDLGVDWPRPTRVVVVRDLLSLSAMTGLPYSSAQTTGTVAVAKWGRITLLSPRASPHGYAWRDTIAHELTHLAVTRATRDSAPLWLQEGVAKREEVRWRPAGPFDDRPPPDVIARRGLERGLGLRFDNLGPSLAMLPSADAAMVAFAEVASFVRFYVQSAGDRGLPMLLEQLKDGKDPNGALVAASGADLATWDARWRAYLSSRPRGGGDASTPGGVSSRAEARAMKELRDRVRLGQLLMSRGHADAALKELAQVRPGAMAWAIGDERAEDDAGIRALRARALERSGRFEEAGPLVADPLHVSSSFGPWWAIRGRWAMGHGNDPMATDSFFEALAADPLDAEAACGTVDPTAPAHDASKEALCEAARARQESPFEAY
jgi:hypothetical protein